MKVEVNDFKREFNETAKHHSFTRAFGGWFKQSSECIEVLELQKSTFGNYYLLNIKVFIQGAFQRQYIPEKDLVKSAIGHVPKQVRDQAFLDFDNYLDDPVRIQMLRAFFENVIVPMSDLALTRTGLIKLSKTGQFSIPPAVFKILTENPV